MGYELKRFRFDCGKCKNTIVGEGVIEYEALPKDWSRSSYYCGDSYCTGHSQEVCPECIKKCKHKRSHKGFMGYYCDECGTKTKGNHDDINSTQANESFS